MKLKLPQTGALAGAECGGSRWARVGPGRHDVCGEAKCGQRWNGYKESDAVYEIQVNWLIYAPAPRTLRPGEKGGASRPWGRQTQDVHPVAQGPQGPQARPVEAESERQSLRKLRGKSSASLPGRLSTSRGALALSLGAGAGGRPGALAPRSAQGHAGLRPTRVL